jgi:hypothetical protein
MPEAQSDRPRCPACGKPVGTYEPLWRVHPGIGAERTSWLKLAVPRQGALEALWHAECAEAAGIDGG